MPAIITHHIFGEDASAILPDGILSGQEDLLAFLLGNQGPDPLWARIRTLPKQARACHTLATRMHTDHMVEVLLSLRNSVSCLADKDRSIGRAFALGMAAHYLLDSMAHPLIYAQQEELISADPSLEDARDEIHAVIESDLDSWVLWEMRRQTVLDTPSTAALMRTDPVDRVAGAMVSQMAWEVFQLHLGADEYGRAVEDYRLFYRAIDPPKSHLLRTLSSLELIKRNYSRLRAQAHVVTTSDTCASANLDHRLWRNPATGEASTASFPDLFHDALYAWPEFSKSLVLGNKNRLSAMIDGINYYGQPV